MNLNVVIDQRAYQDIVISNDPFASFYATPRVQPARGHVYAVVTGLDANVQHIYLGAYTRGQRVVYPFNPATDRNVTFAVIAEAADGTREFSNVRDALKVTALVQLVTTACVIGQAGAATETTVVMAVNNVSPNAVARRIRVYSDAGATTLIGTFYNQNPLPISELLFGSAAQTIYVKVDHSGTPGTAGPWGGVSNLLVLTFANAGGGGGTSGDYDPYGRGQYEL